MNDIKKIRIKKVIALTVGVICICFFIYLIYNYTGFGLKCIFHELTNLRCPGCGTTHFVKCILSGEIKKAFTHNLLFPVFLFYIIWVYAFSVKKYIKNGSFSYKSPYLVFDIIVLIVTVLWFIIRNILKI